MAKIKIKLNEEHIKLIKQFKVERINDIHVGFDTINPYGGSYLMEDLAMILGYWDKVSEEHDETDFYYGRRFGLENEQKMIEIHNYVMDNFEYILSMLIQFSTEGIKPGLYTSIDYNINWEYKEENNNVPFKKDFNETDIECIIGRWNNLGFVDGFKNVRNLSLAFEYLADNLLKLKNNEFAVEKISFPIVRRIFERLTDENDMEIETIKKYVDDILHKLINIEAEFCASFSEKYELNK